MENATKALLIAAAVLIVIAVIAVALKISNAGGNVGGQAESMANSLDVQSFNSQFSVYNGKISGSQLRQLVVVVNNNTTRTVTFKNDTNSPSGVTIENGKINSNDTLIKDSEKYNVSFVYDADGYINEITLSK